MDMRSIRENRGAVSIFLILVLVPCIAFSCIFVDLARVQLSKSMAESAADLALNTLLTNYDADLSEYYGLIGSVQNIEDYYDTAEAFFLRNIKSQGLSEDEIKLLADSAKSLFDDSVVVDLLKTTDQTATITEVKGANLGNPTLLKDSIVEFMKYRGPIEIARGIMERISESGIDGLEDANENEPMVDAKEEFFEAEGELMKAAVYTYVAIQKYVKKAAETPYNNAQLKADEQRIYSYQDVYEQMHEKAVNFLLNTGSLKLYYRPTLDIGAYSNPNIESISMAYSSTGKAEDGTTIYYLNGNDFQALLDYADRELSAFNTAMSNYDLATKDLMANDPLNNGNLSDVQWWVDMNTAVYNGSYGNVHSAITSKGKNMLSAFSALLAAYDNCEAEPTPTNPPQGYQTLPSDWKTTCQNKYNELYDCYTRYLAGNASGDNGYLRAARTLATISSQNINKIKPGDYAFTVNGMTLDFENTLVYISSDLTRLYQIYDALIKLLNDVINGITPPEGEEQKTVSLDKLAELASGYSLKFNKYKQEAETGKANGSSMATKEVDEVINRELEFQQNIDANAVMALKTRLVNIRTQFETLKKEIEGLTYGGKSLKDISSFATFKSCAQTQINSNDIPINQTALDGKCSEWLGLLLKPADGSGVKLSNTDNGDYDPDLTVNTPELYQYLKDELGDITQEDLNDLETAETDEEKAEEEQKKYEEEQKKGATTYRGNAGATMVASESNKFGATGMLGAITSLVSTLAKDGGFASIRDDMYVTTYIMEMFSYATFDREAMYDMLDADQRKAMTPQDPDAYYKNCGKYGDPDGNLMEQPGTWVSEDPEDDYNKSLTNQMINKQNNHVYLAEVEYLLYGKASPADNLKEAYGDIYALRFGLNTISGFQHFWTAGMGNPTAGVIQSIANGLSALFGGVVPATAFKILLIPILAAVETCNDNARLFAGMPVELYKAERDDWWYSLEAGEDADGMAGFLSLLTGKAFENMNQDKGFFYSDYLTLFVYCALTDGKTEAVTYTRLGNLIAANMHKITKKDYSLAKTQMYFRLDANLRVEPLMVTIPYYLDEYDNNLPTATDWCSYKVTVVRGYS